MGMTPLLFSEATSSTTRQVKATPEDQPNKPMPKPMGRRILQGTLLPLAMLSTTLAHGAESSIQLTPSKDTYVALESYSDGWSPHTNFGNRSTVDVGSYHHRAHGLFGFNLEVLDAEAEITGCTLHFPTGSYFLLGNTRSHLYLRLVRDNAAWEEDVVTWVTRPETLWEPYTQFELSEGSAVSVDLGHLCADQRTAGHQEFSVELTTFGPGNVSIHSREMADRYPTPYLEVRQQTDGEN